MLRVLAIITQGVAGGAQVHVLELVRGLVGKVDYHVAVGDDTFLAGELRRLGVPVHVVPEMCWEVSPRADRRALRALHALVARVRPALVHTHSSKAGILGRLAARAAGVPAVHTTHGWSFSDDVPWTRRAFAIPVEAAVSRLTKRIIAVSDADRALATRCRVARPSQLRVVHNGVVDHAARARPDAEGTPIVTMVARMAFPKDHRLLLRACTGIELPFLLRLIGDGPDFARIAAEVRGSELADRVVLLGARADVPALLASSHVFALISRHEGLPLSVLEAMRAGLPVVASDVGGVREAVTHGRTGILVPPGDEVALRAAVRALLSSPALRGALGAAGRRAYEARFTVERMLAETAAIYQESTREAR